MRDTTSRGDLTEIQIAAALMHSGRRVLKPLSNGLRYDLLVDNDDGTFTRVQCKTGALRHGGVVFRVYSVSGHTTRAVSYHGQVDAFGVYCLETGDTYLVPMTAVADCNTMVCLRVSPAKNAQVTRIRQAADFLIRPRDAVTPGH
jgi:hypothetical protein